jgi:hypothetical protein
VQGTNKYDHLAQPPCAACIGHPTIFIPAQTKSFPPSLSGLLLNHRSVERHLFSSSRRSFKILGDPLGPQVPSLR